MANDTQKEIRPIMVSESEYQKFDFDFRILCALNDQTIGERFAELMTFDLRNNIDAFENDWISQADLIELFEKEGKSITRQTLRNHRKDGTLPSDYFVESKIDPDLPNPTKNQRTYYKRDLCLIFYGIEPKEKKTLNGKSKKSAGKKGSGKK